MWTAKLQTVIWAAILAAHTPGPVEDLGLPHTRAREQDGRAGLKLESQQVGLQPVN